MYTETNDLRCLARRVTRKDSDAAVEMRSELERRMVYMVRRLLRTRTATSSLGKRILAEVNRFPGQGRDQPPEDQEHLIRHVVQRISGSVVERLRAGPADSLTASEMAYETALA